MTIIFNKNIKINIIIRKQIFSYLNRIRDLLPTSYNLQPNLARIASDVSAQVRNEKSPYKIFIRIPTISTHFLSRVGRTLRPESRVDFGWTFLQGTGEDKSNVTIVVMCNFHFISYDFPVKKSSY
jgi:hypothetical protein